MIVSSLKAITYNIVLLRSISLSGIYIQPMYQYVDCQIYVENCYDSYTSNMCEVNTSKGVKRYD